MTKAPSRIEAKAEDVTPAKVGQAQPAPSDTPGPELELEPEEAPASTFVHPEEMRATFEIRFGSGGTMNATARCTPAGLVTAGMMVSGILLSVASVIWAARRNPR